jgi:hypothetical protein
VGRAGALGQCAGGIGNAAEAFLDRFAIHHAALHAGDLGLGVFPQGGDFSAQLLAHSFLALGEVRLQGSLPVVQPRADFLFKLLDSGSGGFRGFGGSGLLDLSGQALDFLALACGPGLGLLAGRVGQALESVLERLQFGLVEAQTIFPWWWDVVSRAGGFQAGDACLEFLKVAAYNDFPDAFDRLGRIESWWGCGGHCSSP